jgi:DinB superfamily
MEQSLERTIAVLKRTPGTLDAMLRGLPNEWVRSNEGEGTWSPFDIVVHLIHGDKADWVLRVRLILESKDGVVREFPPYDRTGEMKESQGRALGDMLDEFARVRQASLRTVKELGIGPEEMVLRGRHPKLGEVTLSQLLATWAAHDLNHLHQITRVMAYQYREAVGPFVRFLGVMRCEGHSD